MALKQEMTGLELRRITEDSHCMNTFTKPFASLNENTCNEVHTELQSFNMVKSRSSPYSNKRHPDDSLVKATITWRSVGDNVKGEPNELRSFGTADAYLQHRKSVAATNPYKKATYGEKENVQSGSGWERGSLEFSSRCAINADLSGSVDGKSLQEGPDILSKPGTRPKMKAADEAVKAVGGPGPSFDCKPVNNYKTSPLTTFSGTRCALSPNRQPDFGLEGSMCFASDNSVQSSVIESRKGTCATAWVPESTNEASQIFFLESTLSMKSPLLSPCQGGGDQKNSFLPQKHEAADPSWLSQLENRLKSMQIYEESVHDVSRLCCKIDKTPRSQSNVQSMGECSLPMYFESNIQNLKDAQSCEKIRTQTNDHFVVFFSEQKTLKRSAGKKMRQELLKLSSFCSQYSCKIQSWATCLATGGKIRGCLRCLRKIFSNPPRGFVNLKSDKIPEFSTKATSRSSSRKLAKDKELKAVLTKINEVLVFMERTSPDSMQDNILKDKSQEGFEASGSCSQHDSRSWQQ